MAKPVRPPSPAQAAAQAKAAAARDAIAAAARRGDAAAALAAFSDLRRTGQLAADEWVALGDLLDGRAPLTEVVAAYRTAVSMNRELMIARQKLAYALVRMERPLEALAEYEKGLKVDPRAAPLWIDYGVTLAAQRRAAAAEEAFSKALAIDPRALLALVGRGNAKAAQARYDEAYVDFEKAVTLQPTSPVARFNFAGACLRRRDYAQGFALYESRWSVSAGQPVADPPGLWLGEGDIRGRTILVDAEQGLGDVIMFCRWIPQVVERGAAVTVRAPLPLVDLLRSLDPRIRVIGMDDPSPPRTDHYIAMGSLPLAFRATPQTVPAPPYLHPVGRAGTLVPPPRTGRRRIGICWSGGVAQGLIGVRAVPLQDLLKAVAGAGEVIALQKLASKAERALMAKHDVAFFGDDLHDFSDTAALAASCDIVISIDTSVAHMAGALDLHPWILLPFFSGWCWDEGEHTPWYPNARLWRQTKSDDWAEPLAQIKAALAAEA